MFFAILQNHKELSKLMNVGTASPFPTLESSQGVSPEERSTAELSVVMPCLNEADTLAVCIEKAKRAMTEHGIRGEVIVADNGSTDGSPEIAASLGARVVHVKNRGYGHALMAGISAARSEFVIMGDADDSYDFLEIPKFFEQLSQGAELVQGCRLPAGGGKVLPGAMPFLHRWWGNPMFSVMAQTWFHAPIHDVYCGLRGFRKSLFLQLEQRCTGMEFATEMIIKASLYGARIAEVPITLHPDGRKSHPPHLKTVRDGWRTLRFFLLCSPRWLFLLPGLALIGVGLMGYVLAMPGVTIGRVTFDAHTLLFASLAILCGYQSMIFAVFTKAFAITQHFLPADPKFEKAYSLLKLEKGLIAAAVAMMAGLVLLGIALNEWRLAGFGRLDYASTMRIVIPGATLTAVGFQSVFASFFLAVLGIQRK